MNKTFENCTLLDTKTWFEKCFPIPDEKFQVQLGVHCEEVRETLDELTGLTPEAVFLILRAQRAMRELATFLKNSPVQAVAVHPEREVKFLDALCDTVVTSTGVAHTRRYEFIGAMTAVNNSLFSKFVDGKPIYKASGKVDKGPNFVEPDLTPYLPAQLPGLPAAA